MGKVGKEQLREAFQEELSNIVDEKQSTISLQNGLNEVESNSDTTAHVEFGGNTKINYAPPFTSTFWGSHMGWTLTKTKATLDTEAWQNINSDALHLKPSTQYRVKFDNINDGIVFIYDFNQNRIGGEDHTNLQTEYTFTSPNDGIVYIHITATDTAVTHVVENLEIVEDEFYTEGFIQGVQPVRHPVITAKGKNLFSIEKHVDYGTSKSDRYGLITLSKDEDVSSIKRIDDSIELGVESTSYRGGYFSFNGNPNQTFTLSFDLNMNTSTAILVAYSIDDRITTSGKKSYVFTTDSEGKAIIQFETEYGGTFIIDNIQLELGSTATEFEPYKESQFPIQENFFKEDKLIYDNGKYKKEEYWVEIKLDGSRYWRHGYDYGDHLRIRLREDSLLDRDTSVEPFVIKYDGTLLKYGITSSGADIIDSAHWDGTRDENTLGISVSREETGWTGDPNPPTIQEYLNNHPYKLIYKRKVPVIKEIKGGLHLHKEINNVEVSNGLVVKEVVKPVQNSESKSWYINETGFSDSTPDSPLNYPTNEILSIYKNDAQDASWSFNEHENNTYGGKSYATISQQDFDSTATYSATYRILDTNTVPLQSVNLTVAESIRSTVSDVVKQSTENSNDIARIDSFMPMVQGGIIVESGSNSNGFFIRWSNGLQICVGGISIGANGTWVFPAPFKDRENIFPQATSSGGNRSYISAFSIYRDKDHMDLYVERVGNGDLDTSRHVRLTAIGWWK